MEKQCLESRQEKEKKFRAQSEREDPAAPDPSPEKRPEELANARGATMAHSLWRGERARRQGKGKKNQTGAKKSKTKREPDGFNSTFVARGNLKRLRDCRKDIGELRKGKNFPQKKEGGEQSAENGLRN